MTDLSVTAGCGHQQPSPAASTPDTAEIVETAEKTHIGEDVLKAAKEKIEAHVREIKFKIHRFPASLRGFGRDRDYIAPRIVAIGPYYHGLPELQAMEEVKRMAAYYFFEGLAKTRELRGYYTDEVYERIRSVARDARGCYADAEALKSITDDDFADMMFFDSCFLVQCMISLVSKGQPPFKRVIRSKGRGSILRDMMLLENQIPWPVLQLLMALRSVPMKDFIDFFSSGFHVSWRREQRDVDIDQNFEPPHLLGIIHFYQVSSSSVKKESRLCLERGDFFRFLRKLNCKISVKFFCSKRESVPEESGREVRSKARITLFSRKKKKGVDELTQTTSAAELGEIGVKLIPNGTTKFSDMKVVRGPLFATLSLAPLFLDDPMACCLVNMAAFEQCTGTLGKADYPINSYLSIMAQLMNRDDDVHELRGKRILHTTFDYNQTLKFFKRLAPHLEADSFYFNILVGLEEYKQKRWMWIAIYKFLYKNAKTIATVLSIVGVLVGIFKTLISLKHHQP